MSKLLDIAIDKLRTLPEERKDAMAALLLEEMESDDAWDRRFEGSQDLLAELAAEARDEIARGEVRKGDPSDSVRPD